MKNLIRKNTLLFLFLSLTLGLAPFRPEPHIVGKIRWIMGGANGMGLMDWLDFVMHGTPFVLLFLSLVFKMQYQGQSS